MAEKPPHPYARVLIPTDESANPLSVTASPVFHDGSRADEKLVSGELRCTLTALTPLLVANEHFSAKAVKGARDCGDGMVELPSDWGVPVPVASDKTVLEPWRLPCGRIVLSGSGLKGMLHHSLAALMGAPMTRVEEQFFFYRPNLDVSSSDKNARLEPRVAVVLKHQDENDTLTIRVLPQMHRSQVKFATAKAGARLNTEIGGRQSAAMTGLQYPKPDRRGNQKTTTILPGSRHQELDLNDWVHFTYATGTDGEGELARVFGAPKDYRHALVKAAEFEAGENLDVTADVLAWHDMTADKLADAQQGHLSARHPLSGDNFSRRKQEIANGIQRRKKTIRRPGQLIYVEVEKMPAGEMRVVSLGQNFRYYWMKQNSVRKRSGPKGKERPILLPLESERRVLDPDMEHSPPEALTAGRLLFGYVAETRNSSTTGIGKGDFTQLAGRIAPGHAVERVSDAQAADITRFRSGKQGAVVPLRILGGPKASNDFDRLEGAGYGHLPSDPTGELARIFPLHQPDAAKHPSLYRCHPNHTEDLEIIQKNQAGLARFISSPGAQFGVTIRFRDLRLWELGALMTALCPKLLEDPAAPLAEPNNKTPDFAVKLGHGRPLGLGSIRVDIDSLHQHDPVTGELDADAGLGADALDAFSAIPIAPEVLAAWLDVHRYKGRTYAAYPTATDRNGRSIYAHYTNLRRQEARDSRSRRL
ncbi:hypothetical protein HUK65_13745 [Rhodobacteraceae bacterium 2376]|uniref:CRISPR-associated protein n=1 Tax=Rhabdonatronobacter sediminivivens TaxID=2743469 RepID=A0A7Z0I183_9RHOB|nr:hypothetical protein [Rhabdonatronobacter sediminivivens]NYS26053.1 hypothetical protein [Rhabdonatronobacter sediminivivens]